MAFEEAKRRKIFERTEGRCHICRKKLAWRNYGVHGTRGAWEIEHSNPRSLGGTDRLNNLYPACIACNRSKGASSTKAARKGNGFKVAPLSAAKRGSNAWTGGAVGALVGRVILAPLGPVGMIIGAGIGAAIGKAYEPD